MTPPAKPTRREHREAAIQLLYSQAFIEADLGRVTAGVAMNRTMEEVQSSMHALRQTIAAAQQALGAFEKINATMAELSKPVELRKQVRLDDTSPLSIRAYLATTRTETLRRLDEAARALQFSDALYHEDGLCIRLVTTFDKNKNRVESELGRALEGWSLRRLTAEDGAILRLGITELLFMEDIPQVTAINEYIELSKEFSDAEAPRLVNGILDRIRKAFPREDPPRAPRTGNRPPRKPNP